MATFLIERNLSGASQLTPEHLRDTASTSNEVPGEIGPQTANSDGSAS